MGQSSSSLPSHGVTMHLSRRAVVGLLVVLFGPWLVLGVYYYANNPRPSVPARTIAEGATACAPGPWGDLEYVQILTEPPEQQVAVGFPATDHATWIFEG